jgi:hypothetical protein
MQYKQAINVYSTTEDRLKKLQPGQWVYAGDKSVMGRFCRVKQNGVVVVSWAGNMKHFQTLNQYSKR